MCWASIINGRIILHIFDMNTKVNQYVYPKMLENIVWPEFRGSSIKTHYWFEQDCATAHTTQQMQEWLETKFQGRIISSVRFDSLAC